MCLLQLEWVGVFVGVFECDSPRRELSPITIATSNPLPQTTSLIIPEGRHGHQPNNKSARKYFADATSVNSVIWNSFLTVVLLLLKKIWQFLLG